jgi:hypothetical protein
MGKFGTDSRVVFTLGNDRTEAGKVLTVSEFNPDVYIVIVDQGFISSGTDKGVREVHERMISNKFMTLDFKNIQEADDGNTLHYGGHIQCDGETISCSGNDRQFVTPQQNKVVDKLVKHFVLL